MTEFEFHTSRRMFAVTDHGTFVAEEGDSRTHYEWLVSRLGAGPVESRFKDTTRGYVLDRRLVAYKGNEFSRWVDWRDVIKALDELDRLGIEVDRVGLGIRTGAENQQPWPVLIETSVEQFRTEFSRRAGI